VTAIKKLGGIKKKKNPKLDKFFGVKLVENEFWQENRGITEP